MEILLYAMEESETQTKSFHEEIMTESTCSSPRNCRRRYRNGRPRRSLIQSRHNPLLKTAYRATLQCLLHQTTLPAKQSLDATIGPRHNSSPTVDSHQWKLRLRNISVDSQRENFLRDRAPSEVMWTTSFSESSQGDMLINSVQTLLEKSSKFCWLSQMDLLPLLVLNRTFKFEPVYLVKVRNGRVIETGCSVTYCGASKVFKIKLNNTTIEIDDPNEVVEFMMANVDTENEVWCRVTKRQNVFLGLSVCPVFANYVDLIIDHNELAYRIGSAASAVQEKGSQESMEPSSSSQDIDGKSRITKQISTFLSPLEFLKDFVIRLCVVVADEDGTEIYRIDHDIFKLRAARTNISGYIVIVGTEECSAFLFRRIECWLQYKVYNVWESVKKFLALQEGITSECFTPFAKIVLMAKDASEYFNPSRCVGEQQVGYSEFVIDSFKDIVLAKEYALDLVRNSKALVRQMRRQRQS